MRKNQKQLSFWVNQSIPFTFYHSTKQKARQKSEPKYKLKFFAPVLQILSNALLAHFYYQINFAKWVLSDIIWCNFAIEQSAKNCLTSITGGWPKGNLNWRPTDHYSSEQKNWIYSCIPNPAGAANIWIKKKDIGLPEQDSGFLKIEVTISVLWIAESPCPTTTMHQHNSTRASVPMRCAALLTVLS